MEKTDIQKVLQQHNATHGDFRKNAGVSQDLKYVIRETFKHANTNVLTDDQKEALDMICLKLSRIVTGNPNEPDHWKDIAGYALLIVNRLEADKVFMGNSNPTVRTETLRAVPRVVDPLDFTIPPAPPMPVHQSQDAPKEILERDFPEEPINSDGHLQAAHFHGASYYDRQG